MESNINLDPTPTTSTPMSTSSATPWGIIIGSFLVGIFILGGGATFYMNMMGKSKNLQTEQEQLALQIQQEEAVYEATYGNPLEAADENPLNEVSTNPFDY